MVSPAAKGGTAPRAAIAAARANQSATKPAASNQKAKAAEVAASK